MENTFHFLKLIAGQWVPHKANCRVTATKLSRRKLGTHVSAPRFRSGRGDRWTATNIFFGKLTTCENLRRPLKTPRRRRHLSTWQPTLKVVQAKSRASTHRCRAISWMVGRPLGRWMEIRRCTMTTSELRKWAEQCARDAERMRSDEDRERLLKMQTALLALAAGEDWLAPGQAARNGATMANGGDQQH